MRVSFLIPVFEEETTVGELLRRVAACDVASEGFEREILVCDDGSTDGTRRVIDAMAAQIPGLRVLYHESNRGKGAAIRTLLAHATGDAVLIQDADLEYEVEDCLLLLRRFREGADAVYGSRFLRTSRPSGMRFANLVANRILTASANALYGHHITDEATCLKLIRTSVMRAMDLRCERFELCPEVTAKLGRMGVPIVEVAVRYHARDALAGKKVGWWDGFTAMRVLVEHRVRGSWR